MAENETKTTGGAPPDLKARVAKARATAQALYQHYRHEIAHHRILSNLPPGYRAALKHAADTINSTCRNAGVRLVPEDLVLVLAASTLAPLTFVTLRYTFLFQLFLHSYFAFLYPVLVSLYDAESGDAASAGSDLAGWVVLSLWTVLERAVPGGTRLYERPWYLVLKCGLSYGLFNPRLDGNGHLVRLVVRPRVLPALGIDGGGAAGTKAKKKAAASSSVSSSSAAAAAAKPRDGVGAGAGPTEESDASTQGSKESLFSFVEKSELEQEQQQHQTRTIHLKIESIEGTGWAFPDGTSEFEGPYLVFDVVDGDAEDAEFLPPSHAEMVTGKKVRTPAGTLVEEEEKEEAEAEPAADTKKVEEEAEPELAEEETEKKEADEAGGTDDEPAAETEKKTDGGEEKTKGAEEDANEKTEEKPEQTEEKAPEETKTTEEAEKEDKPEDAPVPAAETQEKEEKEKEETAAPALEPDKTEETEPEKPPKASASFSWPGTSLTVPVVLPPPPSKGRGDDDDDKKKTTTEEEGAPRRLLRAVAYDKRAIGSDAFFGVAYAAVPIAEAEEDGGAEGAATAAATASVVLRDGRTRADDGGAAKVGGVSLALRCG